MNPNEKRDLLEVALQAFGRVLDDPQNRMFSNGAVRPDRFPSEAFPNWVQWKMHFIAVAEANSLTDIQAINALPVCLNGHALDEFVATPTELKQPVNGEPEPTLRALFEHLDRVLGVLRNDRFGRGEFEALAQKEGESLREFARRVRGTGTLVYANMDADQRDEQFTERFIEGLADSDLLKVLLRENTGTFTETVNRAIDLETISKSIRKRPNKRVDTIRVTHDAATVNSNPEMDEMRTQLNAMEVANSLTEMMTQFISAMVPGSSTDVQRLWEPPLCYAGGIEGHPGKVCQQRGNTLNLRGPKTVAEVSSPGRITRHLLTGASRRNCESCCATIEEQTSDC